MARPEPAATDPRTAYAPARCPLSARCRPAAGMLDALDLPTTTPSLWLHLGPFGQRSTVVGRHGSDPRSCHLSTVPTWPEHRGHLGYRLDLFCLDRLPPRTDGGSPGGGSAYRRLIVAPGHSVYVRAMIAWRDPTGPYAAWLIGPEGRTDAIWHFPDGRPRAEAIDELARCDDLLAGRPSRIGRPSRLVADYWRPIAERAEGLYAEHPSLGWQAIATTVGVDERTLRDYRRLLARARAAPPSVQPALIIGG